MGWSLNIIIGGNVSLVIITVSILRTLSDIMFDQWDDWRFSNLIIFVAASKRNVSEQSAWAKVQGVITTHQEKYS